MAHLASKAAQIGYKRRPSRYGGKPAVVADNTLDRQFEVEAPDTVWGTDITYIKTHQGWSYLAFVIDLFSRRVDGWSMQLRMTTHLALQALLSAVWRRKSKAKVMIHSDQGSQFTSKECQSFLGKHNQDASMSRRGNCHDNAVAESFFKLLKRERIRRQKYLTHDAARQDVFDLATISQTQNAGCMIEFRLKSVHKKIDLWRVVFNSGFCLQQIGLYHSYSHQNSLPYAHGFPRTDLTHSLARLCVRGS